MSATHANIIELPTAETTAIQRVHEYGVLLTRPREMAAPDHEYGYRLRHGEVGRCRLERLRLPDGVRPDVLGMPGPVERYTLRTLPAAAELLDRMAPWVTAYVVPALLVSADDGDYAADRSRRVVGGREYTTAGGAAFIRQDVIMLSGTAGATHLLSTAAHEIFHIIEPLLSREARRILSAAASNGPEWHGAYFASESERLARMFQHWAMAYTEGLPGRALPADELSVDFIFQSIWDGTFADRLILSDRVPDAARHRARRGLRLPEPARQPLLERFVREAFGTVRAAFA
jgi:hypothetical protein